MLVVGILAAAALVVLIVAVVTGSTLAALLVVILAVAGLVLLVRDWRAVRDETSPDSAVLDQF